MVIAVASGKGGTGKTLVAVNLALSLHRAGIKTRLVDADVEEPNGHLFVNPLISRRDEVAISVPRIDEDMCDRCGECSSFCAYGALAATPQRVLLFEDLCHGCGGCALVCPHKAIGEKERLIGFVERGVTAEGMAFMQGTLEIGEPKASPIISALKDHLDPQAVNIVDSGPGTGCAVMTTVQGSDVCLMVTEPSLSGLHDLERILKVAEHFGTAALVCINKSDIAPELAMKIRDRCRDLNIEVAAEIPFSEEIVKALRHGRPPIGNLPREAEKPFETLAETLANRLRVGMTETSRQ